MYEDSPRDEVRINAFTSMNWDLEPLGLCCFVENKCKRTDTDPISGNCIVREELSTQNKLNVQLMYRGYLVIRHRINGCEGRAIVNSQGYPH